MLRSHPSIHPSIHRCARSLSAATCWLMAATLFEASAQALASGREVEPVVVEAAVLADWVDVVDLNTINAYIFNGSAFAAIPFQIDKRRKIHVNFNVNQLSDLSYFTHVCEYGYFPELGPPPPAPAPPASPADFGDTLRASDELVFMLKDADAGTIEVSANTWHQNPAVALDRYVLILSDPQTGARRFVYLFRWAGAPGDPSAVDYVSWVPDGTAQCVPIVAGSRGTANGTTSGSLSSEPSLSVHFHENWVTDAFQVNEGGTLRNDFLDRFRYSTANEDENGWSCSGAPRFLGVKDGKVRVVRGVQGALSGRHTTKYEFIYPTQLVSRVNLRVHDLTLLTSRVNHEQAVAAGQRAYVWTQTKKTNAGTYLDLIDASCGTNCGPGNYLYPDWTEIASDDRGSYVHLYRDPRPIPLKPGAANPEYTYSDLQSGGGSPSDYGEFGRKWTDIACTADGSPNNDGGCGAGGPEDPSLMFARLEQTLVPRPSIGDPTLPDDILAQNFQDNVSAPVTRHADKETYLFIPVPPPTPCGPTLAVTNTGSGAVDLTASNPGGCSMPAGYRLFRAIGTGPMEFLRDLRGATTSRDATVFAGKTYRYAAVAYNSRNVQGPMSQEKTITVIDAVAPTAPSLSETSGVGSATLDAGGVCTRDTLGFNVYVSLTSGGPYSRMNAAPIRVTTHPSWVQTGLPSGIPHYFVATTTDFSGNESGYSAEVTVVPGP